MNIMTIDKQEALVEAQVQIHILQGLPKTWLTGSKYHKIISKADTALARIFNSRSETRTILNNELISAWGRWSQE